MVLSSTLQYLRYLGTGYDYSQSSVSNISYRNTKPLKSVLLQEEKRLIQLRKVSNNNSFSLLFYFFFHKFEIRKNRFYDGNDSS